MAGYDGDEGGDYLVVPLAEESGQRLVVASERNQIRPLEVGGDPVQPPLLEIYADEIVTTLNPEFHRAKLLPPLEAMNVSVRAGVRQRQVAKQAEMAARLQFQTHKPPSQKQVQQMEGYAAEAVGAMASEDVERLQDVGLVPKDQADDEAIEGIGLPHGVAKAVPGTMTALEFQKPRVKLLGREITSHWAGGDGDVDLNDLIEIHAVDGPGPGGANHDYLIEMKEPWGPTPYVLLQFQKGGLRETGRRVGISNESLLAIVRDRLLGFQMGPFACEENLIAIAGVDSALETMHRRTRKRVSRGVEGRALP